MALQLRMSGAAAASHPILPKQPSPSLRSGHYHATLRRTPFQNSPTRLQPLGRNAPSPSYRRTPLPVRASPSTPPLDLTEENIQLVLEDARSELGQIFDGSVGITGTVDLAELDGPFVKLRLKGRFWHKRSTVLERMAQYLKNRIPEVLEVEIEDEKQLDDSPENF